MRFLRLRRIHFVGAGGVGMSGLAEILLLSTPLEISGCDRERSENTDRLTALGAKIASHLRKTFPPEGILLPQDRHFFSPGGKPSTELAYLFAPGGNT